MPFVPYVPFVALFRWTARLGDKILDVADLSWQRFAHPTNAISRDQHIVFDSDAHAFVLLKRRPNRRLEFFPLVLFPTKRHLVQRVGTNVNSGLVCEYSARNKLRSTTYVMHIHAQPV